MLGNLVRDRGLFRDPLTTQVRNSPESPDGYLPLWMWTQISKGRIFSSFWSNWQREESWVMKIPRVGERNLMMNWSTNKPETLGIINQMDPAWDKRSL